MPDYTQQLVSAVERVGDLIEGTRDDSRKRMKDFWRSLLEGELRGISGLDLSMIESHLETLAAQGKYEYVTTTHGVVLRIDRAEPSNTWMLSLNLGDGVTAPTLRWTKVEVGDDRADD